MAEEYELKSKKHYIIRMAGIDGMVSNLEFDSEKEILFGNIQVNYVVKNFYINFKEDACGLLDKSEMYSIHMDVLYSFKERLKKAMASGFDKNGKIHIEKTYNFEENEYWAITK
jgi:hypothetical protein